MLHQQFRADSRTLFVHCACANFEDVGDGEPTPITAISVYSEFRGETKSFSIHRQLSKRKRTSVDADTLTDKEILDAERQMLREFVSYTKSHSEDRWMHWDLRDPKYGFDMISDRCSFFGISTPRVDESLRINLKQPIREIYGRDFAHHPRMLSLAKLNGIVAIDALDGKSEGACYQKKLFKSAADSSLRKVRIIREVAYLAGEGTLKTEMKWFRSPLVALAGSVDWFLDHLVFRLLTIFLALWGVGEICLRIVISLL